MTTPTLKSSEPLLPPSRQLAWLAPIEAFTQFQKPEGEWAGSDAAWVYRYLCNGCGSEATRKSVQSELLRLAFFMKKHRIEKLADLTSDDAAMYRQWLTNKKDADEVSARPVTRLMNNQLNPQWRPFRTIQPLALNAQKTALRLISGCLAFLQDDPSCAVQGNPFRRLAKTVEQTKRQVTDVDDDTVLYTKALSPQALDALFAYMNSKHFRGSERSRIAKRWLLTLLSHTAVRVESLISLTTDNLHSDPTQPGRLRLRFRAKHNSRVDQLWTPTLHNGYLSYRNCFGLHWPPLPGEPTHLWFGIKSTPGTTPQPVKSSSVWAMVQTLGRQTAQWVNSESAEIPATIQDYWSPQDTTMLNQLHPHIFRHTWCTHAINIEKRDLLQAKQHMGHTSVTVTERYLSPDTRNQYQKNSDRKDVIESIF